MNPVLILGPIATMIAVALVVTGLLSIEFRRLKAKSK
jgi:hypothetical protein